MRKCKSCNEVKNCEDFYTFNRLHCKKCHIQKTIEWQRNNREKYMEKLRTNPEYRRKQAKYYKQWYRDGGRKRSKQQLESAKMWTKLNPKARHASCLLRDAVKIGKIIKPKICETCRKERKLDAHHEDYHFPFKVKWLCHSCHKTLHSGIYET